MARPSVTSLYKRAEQSWNRKMNWDDVLRDIYRYLLPQRNLYDTQNPGQKKGMEVFDSTGPRSFVRAANRIVSLIFPAGEKWAKLEPGPGVPEEERENLAEALEKINDIVFSMINNGSNFSQAIGEWALELLTGTASMLITKGTTEQPLNYEVIPQIQVGYEGGEFGMIGAEFRKLKITAGAVTRQWPDAKLPQELVEKIKEDPGAELDGLFECIYRDENPDLDFWYYDVIWKGSKKRIVMRKYDSCPMPTTRWMKLPGEDNGRGPANQAIYDVKTKNKLTELVLKNAALAIGGVYTAADDGVLNPDTVRIAPGAIVKVARNQGHPSGASLAPLERPGDFNVSSIVGEQLDEAIKGAFFDEGMPPINAGVRSATEIVERMKDLQVDIGGAFGRLIVEAAIPFYQRTLDVLVSEGYVSLPSRLKIGGMQVRLVSIAPMSKMQNTEELQAMVQAVELSNALVGPQITGLKYRLEDIPGMIVEKTAAPASMLRDETEEEELTQAIAQMLAQMQMAQQQQGQAAAA